MNNSLIKLGAVLILAFTGCITNTEDTTVGPEIPPPPVENVRFSTQIQPIFNGSCGGGACHTNGGSASGVSLSSYAQTVGSVGSRYGENVVLSGNATGSPIVDKLLPNPRFGSRMPLGRSPLTNEQIELIRVWINEGAIDN